MIAMKVHGGSNLELRILEGNSECAKINIMNDRTVMSLKELIANQPKTYEANCCSLYHNGIELNDLKKLSDCKIKSGDSLHMSKISLSKVRGIELTYDEDIITLDDSKDEYRALMPCKHAISSESMT